MIPITALVEEPATGAWVADVVTTDKPTFPLSIGEVDWTGTPASPGPMLDGSRWRCRVVGGAGKLGTVLRAKNYGTVPYSRVVSDILRECGETAGTINAIGQTPYYERADEQTAGEALAELCAAAGVTWWVDRAGLVQVAPARPSGTVDETVLHRLSLDESGTVIFNAENASTLLPGQTLDGNVLGALRWSLSAKRLTVDCAVAAVTFPDQRDRFYERTYSAKVATQNGDGSVNVIANGAFELSNVPLLSGIPGAVLKMLPGDLVAVGFFGGNRSTPYAVATLQGGSSAQPIALNGDTVTMLLPPFALTGTALIAGVPTAITGVMTALTGQTLGTVTGPSSARTKLQ